jgi:hypothetical protein
VNGPRQGDGVVRVGSIEAVVSAWRQYFGFSGRASRAEFWWYCLVFLVVTDALSAVAIVNSIKVRTAELLVARGAMPPVISRSTSVGAERSRALFEAAYREHARRLARAIDTSRSPGAGARPSSGEPGQ